MKIFKDGTEVAELPAKPQNYDGGCKGGALFITRGDEKITLAHYDTYESASAVNHALCKAYLAGNDSFDLPSEKK